MKRIVNGQEVDPNEVGEGTLSPEQRIYKENILDHYRNPRNKTHIDTTYHAKDKNPLCGDELEAFVILDGEKVTEIGFLGSGCAISQASMSMLTKRLKGKSRNAVLQLDQDFVLDMLGIPIGVVRRKCALLGLRVIQKALGDTHA